MNAAPASARAASDIALRAFGVDRADLDVDLGAPDREAVVTAVLERCARDGDGAPLSPEDAWALPVGDRLHALVAICRLSGRSALDWSLACPASGCDEEVEIELPLAVLAAAAREGAAAWPAEVTWDGSTFRPRRPTGEDLRSWRQQLPSDADILVALGGPRHAPAAPPPELVTAVEEALAAVDPLVDVHVHSECPACGEALDVPVDLEGEAVALARRWQDELLRDVAALARALGWGEPEILALPVWRRRRYLAILEQADT
jgi:hypothetical protein